MDIEATYRIEALRYASGLRHLGSTAQELIEAAEKIYQWLRSGKESDSPPHLKVA